MPGFCLAITLVFLTAAYSCGATPELKSGTTPAEQQRLEKIYKAKASWEAARDHYQIALANYGAGSPETKRAKAEMERTWTLYSQLDAKGASPIHPEQGMPTGNPGNPEPPPVPESPNQMKNF